MAIKTFPLWGMSNAEREALIDEIFRMTPQRGSKDWNHMAPRRGTIYRGKVSRSEIAVILNVMKKIERMP